MVIECLKKLFEQNSNLFNLMNNESCKDKITNIANEKIFFDV